MRLIGVSCRNLPAFIGKVKPVLQDEVVPRGERRILQGMVRGVIVPWPAPEAMPPHGCLLLYTRAAADCPSGFLPDYDTVRALNPKQAWHTIVGVSGGVSGQVALVQDWRALTALLDPIAAHAITHWRTERADSRIAASLWSYAQCAARELMAMEALGDERLFELYAMLYQAIPVAARPSLEGEIRFRFGYRAPRVLELAKKSPERA